MGLSDHDLEAIAQDKDEMAEKCLTEVVVQWFRNHSPVTWKKVVVLAAAKSGGNAPKKATTIARDYKGMGVGEEEGGRGEDLLQECLYTTCMSFHVRV